MALSALTINIGDRTNKYYLFGVLDDLASLGAGITWKDGQEVKATDVHRLGDYEHFLVYNSDKNCIYVDDSPIMVGTGFTKVRWHSNSIDPHLIGNLFFVSTDFLNAVQDCYTHKQAALAQIGTLLKTVKRDAYDSSLWNCMCSNCKSPAYDTGMSFECSNGCTQATGIFPVKGN